MKNLRPAAAVAAAQLLLTLLLLDAVGAQQFIAVSWVAEPSAQRAARYKLFFFKVKLLFKSMWHNVTL